MVLPPGSVMVIGLMAGCLFITDAPSTTKWPAAPESEIAHATLATNLLVDIFCHSTFSLLNNIRRALCLVGAVIAHLLVLSTITFSIGGCSGGAASKLLL